MPSFTVSAPTDKAVPMDSASQLESQSLVARGVSKRFAGVQALKDVSLEVHGGEVHVFFGENGAGKSTLVNLFVGNYRPDEGTISLNGRELAFDSPADGRQAGINAVFQEFSLVPTLSVAANIFLGREIITRHRLDGKAMRQQAKEVLSDLGFDLDPDVQVSRLSRAQQQMVEIAKALQGSPRVLILDEPTASLTERETDVLFALVERFRAAGLAIIYITHRVHEIQRIANRVTVLRDGRFVATIDAKDADENRLVELMTGREPTALYPPLPRRTDDREVLRLEGASTADGSVRDVSLHVAAGEVVGLAGLVGSGKDEIGQLIVGTKALSSGSMWLFGQEMRKVNPRRTLSRGVFYLPADRKRHGLFPPLSLQQNASMAGIATGRLGRGPLVRADQESRDFKAVAERMSIRPFQPMRPIIQFSGGNQQKALIARGLLIDPKLVVLCEPTTGVDVGARAEIYQIVADLCEQGVSVLLISSDLPEILNLCHRAYSVSGGRIQAEFEGESLNEAELLTSFFREDMS